MNYMDTIFGWESVSIIMLLNLSLILRWQLKLYLEGQESNEFSREYKFKHYMFIIFSILHGVIFVQSCWQTMSTIFYL
jgi:hypothetical protein